MLIPTRDGSFTLKNSNLNVTYHSLHGALQESDHVFIQSGLHHFYSSSAIKPIQLFEMGFGSGLNAILSYEFALKYACPIQYHGIEAFPISNFPLTQFVQSNIRLKNLENTLSQMHDCEWNATHDLHDYFTFAKWNQNIQTALIPSDFFHIIYYDAFAPSAQPELWSVDTMRIMYNALQENGFLVTYCSQGQFQRNLKEVGFEVEKIPGPPGKREIIRAYKKNCFVL